MIVSKKSGYIVESIYLISEILICSCNYLLIMTLPLVTRPSEKEIVCFHCIHYGNFSSILDEGIQSVHTLVKNGKTPVDDFICKSGGGGKNYMASHGNCKEPLYNDVNFSYGGMWGEAPNQYYDDLIPIGFGYGMEKLLEGFRLGFNSNGDVQVADKQSTEPTKINLCDAEVMFFPDDVYFDDDNRLVEVRAGERMSLWTSAFYTMERKERAEASLKKFHDIKEASKQAGLLNYVRDVLYNTYDDCRDKGDREERTSDHGEARREYMEFDNISGLKTLDRYEIDEMLDIIKRNLQILPGEVPDKLKYMDFQLEDVGDKRRKYVKDILSKHTDSDKELYAYKIAEMLLRRSPGYITRGYTPDTDEETVLDRIYDEYKDDIDSFVLELNKSVSGPYGKFNPSEFNTISGRALYTPSGQLIEFVKLKKRWREYKRDCEDKGYLNSKDFLRKRLEEKGAKIEDYGDEWNIVNFNDVNLPPKVLFFGNEGDDLTGAVNEYLRKNNKFSFSEPNVEHNKRKRVSVPIEDGLKESCVPAGEIITPYYSCMAYTKEQS